MNASGGKLAIARKTELQVCVEPVGRQAEAGVVQLGNHVAKILPHEMRQHETVVQFGAPAHQGCRAERLAPEARHQGAQQQLLGQRHARVRRHFEGAHFQEPQATGSRIRRIQFVDTEFGAMGIAGRIDQQVAQDAIEFPRRAGAGILAHQALDCGKRNLDFIDRIVARLVNAWRLAGRADEHAREQERQRGVVVPVPDQTLQQVRPAQKR